MPRIRIANRIVGIFRVNLIQPNNAEGVVSSIFSQEVSESGFTRRRFLRSIGRVSLLPAFAYGNARSSLADESVGLGSKFETEFDSVVESKSVPAVVACMFDRDGIQWSRGAGLANVDANTPMTPSTIMNIGSISKTITATAVMLLWERNRIDLDRDINEYLPFAARNPNFSGLPITVRQLLTHTSSIRDSSAYDESYHCGDPTVSLSDWIRGYVISEGTYFDREKNFHAAKPGEKVDYSNIGFGVLGLLAETVSGTKFSDFCDKEIFQPLEMQNTSWFLSGVDRSQHALPYTYATPLANRKGGREVMRGDGTVKVKVKEKTFVPHCLYSFPNYPDGLLRTNVEELARFARLFVNEGRDGDNQFLQTKTVKTMLSPQTEKDPSQGLAWSKSKTSSGDVLWGHSGGDPGILTMLRISEKSGRGYVAFQNCDRTSPFRRTVKLVSKKWLG